MEKIWIELKIDISLCTADI